MNISNILVKDYISTFRESPDGYLRYHVPTRILNNILAVSGRSEMADIIKKELATRLNRKESK